MRAALLYGAGDVRVETVPDPVVQDPGDAIVRVTHASVCGTDLHPYRDAEPVADGVPMGHELIGVVEEAGSDLAGFAVGDSVLSTFSFQDNTCSYCAEGVQTACAQGGFIAGAQAELVRVPLADGTLVRLPSGVDDELAASLLTLADVYGTGHHAARSARVRPGETVVVIGDGAVGLLCVLAARRLGAERIVIMGRHPARTDLARELGATDVVAERGEEGISAVNDLTGGGAPRVLEAVGHLSAYDQAVGVVRPGGVISRVGVPQYEDAPIGFASLFGRNVGLAGGVAPVRAYVDELLPAVLDGSVRPGVVFDHTVPLAEVAEGYRAMDRRAAIKSLVRV